MEQRYGIQKQLFFKRKTRRSKMVRYTMNKQITREMGDRQIGREPGGLWRINRYGYFRISAAVRDHSMPPFQCSALVSVKVAKIRRDVGVWKSRGRQKQKLANGISRLHRPRSSTNILQILASKLRIILLDFSPSPPSPRISLFPLKADLFDLIAITHEEEKW